MDIFGNLAYSFWIQLDVHDLAGLSSFQWRGQGTHHISCWPRDSLNFYIGHKHHLQCQSLESETPPTDWSRTWVEAKRRKQITRESEKKHKLPKASFWRVPGICFFENLWRIIYCSNQFVFCDQTLKRSLVTSRIGWTLQCEPQFHHLAEVPATRNTPPIELPLRLRYSRKKNLQKSTILGTFSYNFNISIIFGIGHPHIPSPTTRVTERSLLPQWRPCFRRFRTSPRWRQPTSPRSRDIGVWWSTMETPGGWTNSGEIGGGKMLKHFGHSWDTSIFFDIRFSNIC